MPSNFTGIATMKKWVDFFHEKNATYDLNENEMRQLKFDLETVMSQFNEIVLGARWNSNEFIYRIKLILYKRSLLKISQNSCINN